MPEHESSPEISRWTNFLRSTVIEGRQRIEDEFERTNQNWLNCFASVTGQIKASLEFALQEKIIPEDKLEHIQTTYSEMEETFYTYRTQYTNANQPPQDIRNELLRYLDTLRTYLE